MTEQPDAEPRDWPADMPEREEWWQRPWLLAGLGLAAGLLAHLIVGESGAPATALRLALLALATVTATLIGFTLERRRWRAAFIFSVATGVIVALVSWWNGPVGGWSAGEGWRTVSLLLSVAIAAPLFQAARDAGALRFAYPAVHDHAWTNVVLWFAGWVFVALVFAMMWLLAALFQLIKLEFLSDLLREDWFWRSLAGLAFGAAIGLLREHDRVVHLLQRVVATVLAVLAPVLAAGLLLFLLALPFTGLNALWEATRATTPVLLSCLIGALILANAVIGNAPEQESRFPLLRFGAIVLAATTLPLGVIAAIATGLRVGQYGYTPERLWAVTFVGIALLYGLGYWWSLIRGQLDWERVVRPVNLRLAFVVAGVALFLATPILSFNAISVRDQVGRLESGKVTVDKFDWRALAFDFGEPGRAALKRLQASRNAAIKTRADEVAKAEGRWSVAESPVTVDVAAVAGRLRTLPQGATLPPALLDYIARFDRCGSDRDSRCTVYMLPGGQAALLLADICFGKPPSGRRVYCRGPEKMWLVDGEWGVSPKTPAPPDDAARIAEGEAYRAGEIEIRPVTRRQVFVGGVPVGDPFE